ncbi:MAG: T9SS type A sorting domain-containing protein, partial [Bacteroidales bacterium]|nr:T9SS type A sorting domain-containing protein [Bacteroidales bacterium]
RFLGKIPPMSSDTILVHPAFDFSQAGTYNIKAYIDTIKITTDVSNDTITRIIEVHPDVSLQSLENMGNKRIGDTVYAKVSIKNTGDLLIPETPLRLQINNSNDIVETLQTPLYPGDSIEYIFTQPYIVPEVNTVQPYYQISVATELSCDYMASNNKATLIAGVSVVELQVLSIETPDPLVCDTGFSYVYPSIQLSNNGHNDLENVRIYVKVDSASMEVSKISEEFASVPVGAQVYTFTTPYPVPNLTGNYEVTVFIDKVTGEMDDSNDTLSMEACAIEFGTAVLGYDASANWTMGQNMPNPASAATQITYSIPQEGVIHFTLTTITGQLIHSQDISSAAGSYSLEFDTQHLAGGIYYYSMEYQGQRIVKKMTIQKK